jgi:hemolysin D
MKTPLPTMPADTALQPHPFSALVARYRTVFKAAWAARRELAGPRHATDEAAFLPAALSLQVTPAHPAPRRVAWGLCALFLSALVWSVWGQMDIVAIAPGRIVVSERTKTLQPLETSVVKRIAVKNGDLVQAGQVLVELDATNATADTASVQEQWGMAWSEEQRSAALLNALRSGKAPVLTRAMLESGGGLQQGAQTTVQLQTEWADISAKLNKLAAEQVRRQAELATVREVIYKLEATLPIATQRESDFKGLAEQGFMSSHAGQDRTRERIEQERDLATQKAKLMEAQATLKEGENTRSAYLAETQRMLSERQALAASKRQQFTQERSKTEHRSRLNQLTAPVAGTVQQVAVHTEGGVVTPAQVLMVIVPKDAEMTAEVVIDNKDIGFVSAGQTVAVKLETFPFTRYGTVPAQVRTVARDAVTDEQKGAIFPAVLSLDQTSINVDGKRIALSPGMNVTAEIKTGKRRIIDYWFSPVRKSVAESLGER